MNLRAQLNYATLVSGFSDTLRNRSVFFRLMAENAFTRAPFHVPFGVVSGPASGSVVPEGASIPVSRLSLANVTLEPRKVAALVVMTADLVRNTSAASQALFARELRGAVSDAADGALFDSTIDSSTPQFTSSGNDVDDIRADLFQMLSAVNSVGSAALYWVAAPDVAKRLSTIATSGGSDAFPNASALGGELLNLPLLVSSVLPAGTLYLLNAGSIAAEAGAIEVADSEHATVQMNDEPTGDSVTPTASALVSMLQTNSVALRATVMMAVERLRVDAIAKLDGISWMGEATA